MPVEATPSNNSTVIITQNDAGEFKKAVLKRSILAVVFFGLSAFVFAAEALDLVQAIKGDGVLIRLLPLLAGLLGGFAAAQSRLFLREKRK